LSIGPKTLAPEHCVFVDESGIENTLCREYARAKRGLQIIGERQGKKKQRYSILAGLR